MVVRIVDIIKEEKTYETICTLDSLMNFFASREVISSDFNGQYSNTLNLIYIVLNRLKLNLFEYSYNDINSSKEFNILGERNNISYAINSNMNVKIEYESFEAKTLYKNKSKAYKGDYLVRFSFSNEEKATSNINLTIRWNFDNFVVHYGSIELENIEIGEKYMLVPIDKESEYYKVVTIDENSSYKAVGEVEIETIYKLISSLDIKAFANYKHLPEFRAYNKPKVFHKQRLKVA